MSSSLHTSEWHRQRVWDPAIRIWHWLLVLSVCGGWLLGEFRDFDTIAVHIYCGYFTGVLLLLRVLWGLIGPPPVRFAALWPRPGALLGYLGRLSQRRPSGEAGHSPLGALAVLALLGVLSFQVITGLGTEDDDLFDGGPLVRFLDGRTVLTLTDLHGLGSTLVLVLVGLHLAAVLFYLLWKRENLITPMINGWKWVRRSR